MEKILISIVVLTTLISCKTENKETLVNSIEYKCTPCNLDCDTIRFDKAGICPHCKMKLIVVSQKISFKELQNYEGRYEYVGISTLDIIASKLDTLLYAVIDKAKYPLKYISKDNFINIGDEPIVFQRNKNNKVTSYQADNKTFKLLTTEFERMEMLPRKELFQNSEKYIYQKPLKIQDGLEVGDLKKEFKNPELIIKMIKKTIEGIYPNIHSVLIYKNNKLVLEEYFYGYNQNIPHQLRSASKPFVGTLIGIAVDRKLIGSEKNKLLPYFNKKYDAISNLDKQKEQITIEDFLMYQHGMDCDNNNPKSMGSEQRMMDSKDWTKHTLDLPMINEPGKSSLYCTGCELVLGDLLEIVAKEEIEIFAEENLFSPMGITNYQWRFASNQSSINTFSQMYITPRDLVKLAKMYKDKGKWNGKQILSKSWVNKTFTMEDGDYGYFWKNKIFTIEGKQYNSYMATGNGGQKINIWPELDMITVFTGGNYNYYQIYGKSTPPNEMIPNYILKALE